MSRHRNKAVDLLQHYLRRATEGSGGKWGEDYDAEVSEIVDSIIDASSSKAVGAVHQESPIFAKRKLFTPLDMDVQRADVVKRIADFVEQFGEAPAADWAQRIRDTFERDEDARTLDAVDPIVADSGTRSTRES